MEPLVDGPVARPTRREYQVSVEETMSPFIRRMLFVIAALGLWTLADSTEAQTRETGYAVLSVRVEEPADPLFRGQAAAERKPTFAERVRQTFSNFLRDDEDDWDEEPTRRPQQTQPTNTSTNTPATSTPTRPPRPVRVTDIQNAEKEADAKPAAAERSVADQRAQNTARTPAPASTTESRPSARTTEPARDVTEGPMSLDIARDTEQNFDASAQEEDFFNKLQEMRKSVFDKQQDNDPARSATTVSVPRVAGRTVPSRGDSGSLAAAPAAAAPAMRRDINLETEAEPLPFRERPAETATTERRLPPQEASLTAETRSEPRQVTVEGGRTPVLQGIDRVPRQNPLTTATQTSGRNAVTSERRVSGVRGEQQLGTRVIADSTSSVPPTATLAATIPAEPLPQQAVSVPSAAIASASASTDGSSRSSAPRTKAMMVSPRLDVETECDGHVMVGQESNYRVRVVNRGGAPAENVTLRIDVPGWIEVAQPDVTQGRVAIQRREGDSELYEMVWTLGLLRSQAEEQLLLRLIPRERKSVDLKVRYDFNRPTSVATINVQEVVLEMELDGPDEVQWGTQIGYRLVVRNVGNGDAEDIQLELLQTGSEMKSCELPLLRAGEEQSVVVDVWTGKQATVDIDVQATSSFGEKCVVQKRISVLRPDILMTIESPTAQFVGNDAEYVIKIQNLGTADAKNLSMVTNVPLGAELVSCSEEGAVNENNQVVWKVPSLPVGEMYVAGIVCKAKREGDCILETAVSDRSGVLAQCDGSFLAVAIVDLKVDVATPEGPVEVGKEAIYTISLENRGTKSAENVEVTASFGRGLEPFAVEGGNAYMKDGQVVFDTFAAISAGQKVVLKVKGKADSPGSHRIRTDIVCSGSNTHLVNEQTSYFFQRQRGKNTVATNRQSEGLRPRESGEAVPKPLPPQPAMEAQARDPFLQ